MQTKLTAIFFSFQILLHGRVVPRPFIKLVSFPNAQPGEGCSKAIRRTPVSTRRRVSLPPQREAHLTDPQAPNDHDQIQSQKQPNIAEIYASNNSKGSWGFTTEKVKGTLGTFLFRSNTAGCSRESPLMQQSAQSQFNRPFLLMVALLQLMPGSSRPRSTLGKDEFPTGGGRAHLWPQTMSLSTAPGILTWVTRPHTQKAQHSRAPQVGKSNYFT